MERQLEQPVQLRVRIALWQQPHQRRHMAEREGGVRMVHQPVGAGARDLDDVGAEMFVEPRPPGRPHRIAGLQRRRMPARGAAAHQAEMPAMGSRQQLDDGVAFAMAPHAEDDAVVGPLHVQTLLRRLNALEQVLIAKVFQLLRNML